MSVDKTTVAKIASLARIKMGDEELDRMVPELNNILEWVEQLGEVDCTGVEPMTAVIPNHLRLREDVVDADPEDRGPAGATMCWPMHPSQSTASSGVPKVIE